MIYLFYGDNEYAARQQLSRLTERFLKSTGSDFGLHKFSEDSDPSQVVGALNSAPMFSDSSLVIVEHPSRSQRLIEAITPVLDRVPEKTVLVLLDPGIDKRKTWFKSLMKLANVKEFKVKPEPQLIRWVEKTVGEQGSSISKPAVRLLIEYVGDDEWQLSNEIKKLATAGDEIGEKQVRDLVQPAPRQTIFTLLDELSKGNLDKSLAYLDDLKAQKIHELEILAMLGWHLRTLLVVASAGSTSDEKISKDHGINPFVLRKAKPLARRLELATITRAYRGVIDTDYAIKTSQQEPEYLIERLLIKLNEDFKA